MSTTETPTYDGEQARRTGRIIGGSVIATVGAVIALAGGGVLALGGSDGTLDSGTHDLSSSTSALVSESADLDGVDDVSDVVGQPRLRISAETANPDKAVFVGVGPKDEVDRYLAGVSIDRVTDFDGSPWSSLEKHRVDGTKTAVPPARKSFWVAKSMGSTASIDWKVRDGEYRAVVMNADGSRVVATDTKFEVEIPYLGTIALVTLIAGLVMLAGGVALIVPSMRGGGSAPTRQQPQTQTYAIG